MNLLYSEGLVFLVPPRNGGFARGVIARASSEGKALFGYFFGPRVASAEAANFDDLQPATAVLRVMFGDLGLLKGEWPIRGTAKDWNRALWPMPEFVR
jgi:hypothetical protein